MGDAMGGFILGVMSVVISQGWLRMVWQVFRRSRTQKFGVMDILIVEAEKQARLVERIRIRRNIRMVGRRRGKEMTDAEINVLLGTDND